MPDAKQLLDHQFLEMRWRCLSLASDLDRIQRAPGGTNLLRGDRRLQSLRQAIMVLTEFAQDRAARVQMIFSDMTPRTDGKNSQGADARTQDAAKGATGK